MPKILAYSYLPSQGVKKPSHEYHFVLPRLLVPEHGEQPEVGLLRGLELADELESVGLEDLP